jgi:hypothetical protein
VAEIWRYDGGEVNIHLLEEGEYKKSSESLAFPQATGPTLTTFIRESQQMRRTAWLRKLREWIKS